jgi:hypothetical protein
MLVGEHKVRLPKMVVATFVAAILVSAFLVINFQRYGEQRARASLLSLAASTAAGIDIEQVKKLTGTPADVGTPNFEAIRATLKRIRSATPGIRFVYLMNIKEGSVTFMADAEPADSADYSAPRRPL